MLTCVVLIERLEVFALRFSNGLEIQKIWFSLHDIFEQPANKSI